MIKLDLTKNKTLSFDLDIEGTDVIPESVELVLEGEQYGDILIRGSAEGNKVTVEIMSESVKAYNTIFPNKKEISSKLNVVLEGKRFTPWSGDFQIVKPVEVKVKEEKVSGLKAENVSAKVTANLDEDVDEVVEVTQETKEKVSLKDKFNQV